MFELDSPWIVERRNGLHRLGAVYLLTHRLAFYWMIYDRIRVFKTELNVAYVQAGTVLSLLPILTQSVMACPLWMLAGLINVGVFLLAISPGGPPASCLDTYFLAELAFLGYTERINTERYSAGDGGKIFQGCK